MKDRKSGHKIHEMLIDRWSPRAMSGEGMDWNGLMELFEAARWAPSSYNNQPWRFIYALRNTEHWENLFELMIDFNKSWARNAAALVVVISKKTFDHNGEDSITHSFDAGAAWENLALQASANGLIAHGMQGFDYEKARNTLKIPDGYKVEAMIAIGKVGKKEDLPQELQEREFPSDRKKINEIAFEGKFMGE